MWIEVLKALPSMVTAGAAVGTFFIALQGLQKWRQETVGKRKMELAEEVIADFYEARDIIKAARSRGRFSHEGTTRPKGRGESEEDTETLNAYYAVVERLSNKGEFFARLAARRYRFIAFFGKQEAAPFQQLFQLHGEIVATVSTLRMIGTRPVRELNLEKMENVIFETSGNDHISRRLDDMVEAIEKVCRPAIQEVAKRR